MAYEKINFSDGQILKAEHLNHIEEGITACSTEIKNLNTTTMSVASGVTVANNPQALHWDGTIGDREYIVTENDMVLVRLYDDVPDLSAHLALGLTDMIPIMISMTELGVEDTEETIPIVTQGGLVMAPRQEDGFIIAETVFIVPYDDYVYETITFPKKGIYGMAMSSISQGIDTSIMHVSGIAIAGNDFSSASKYFEKQTITTKIRDTLTWDGVIGDREYGHLEIEGIKIDIVCVSHSTPTAEELSAITSGSMTVIQDNNIITYDTISEVLEATDSNGKSHTRIKFSNSSLENDTGTAYITYENNTLVDGTNLPSPGIYFIKYNFEIASVYISSITLSGYQFIETKTAEVIKTEHLPEALRFGMVDSDTLTWDGDTTGKTSVADTFYKVSNSEINMDNLAGGMYGVAIVEGEEMLQTSEEEPPVEIISGIIIFGELAVFVTSERAGAIIDDLDGIVFPEPGVYFTKDGEAYAKSLTIPGYTGFQSVKKIDPKYLPEPSFNADGIIIKSSTPSSDKHFRITVDDSGVISAVEVTE